MNNDIVLSSWYKMLDYLFYTNFIYCLYKIFQYVSILSICYFVFVLFLNRSEIVNYFNKKKSNDKILKHYFKNKKRNSR